MSSKFLGIAVLVALCGAASAATAQAPEAQRPAPPRPAAVDAERAAKAQEMRERRAAAAAARGAEPRPTAADLSPEDRDRLLRERRARGAALKGDRAERIRAVGARETALAGRAVRPPSPELVRSRMTLRLRGLENGHNRRLAQLQRIRHLAAQASDDATVTRVDELLANETRMYDSQVAGLKQRMEHMGDRPAMRPGMRPGMRLEGRPGAERPVPPRAVPARPAPPRPVAPRPEGATGGGER